ncbi:hypothetical protein ACLVWU_09745 [Bdellovibrio sp. HCB290]|uniref:hypothetical protein n=1 Tax=Bdellovibrio sp. HCB290 TaxID=3394356 RepID=UPI0039B598C2
MKSGKKMGLGYELYQEILSRLGCHQTEFVGSVPGVLAAFSRYQIDVIGPLSSKLNLSNSVFVDLWSARRKMAIRKNKVTSGINDFKHYLKDPKVIFGALIAGNFYFTDKERSLLEAQNRLRSFANTEDLIRALLEGRIDAIIAGDIIFAHYLNEQREFRQLHFAEDNEGQKMTWGFFLSKRRLNALEMKSMVNVLTQMKKEGVVDRLLRKYTTLQIGRDPNGGTGKGSEVLTTGK